MPWAPDVVLPDSRHESRVRTCLVGVQICSRLEAAVLLRRMCCAGGRCRIPALRLPAPLTGGEPLQEVLGKLQSPVQYLHSLLQFQKAQQSWSFQEPICHCLESVRELLFVTFVVAFCPPPLCICLCSLPPIMAFQLHTLCFSGLLTLSMFHMVAPWTSTISSFTSQLVPYAILLHLFPETPNSPSI